jgi:hypothetical protein
VVKEAQGLVLLSAARKPSRGASGWSDGALYVIRANDGIPQYRITLYGETMAERPISWWDINHISHSVWFIGTSPTSTIYAYSVAGQNNPTDQACEEPSSLIGVFLVGLVPIAVVSTMLAFAVVRRRRAKPVTLPPPQPPPAS